MQFLAATTFDAPVFTDFFKLPLQPRNFFLYPPPIDFELRFSRSPATDTAALPGQVRPHTSKTRQHVIELGEFDLNLAFTSPSALRKNIENEFRPVDYLYGWAKNFAEVATLRRRQVIVENHGIGGQRLTTVGDFGGFAFADESRRAGRIAFLGEQFENAHASGFREFPEFGKRILGRPPVLAGPFQTDEQCRLGWWRLRVVHLQRDGNFSKIFAAVIAGGSSAATGIHTKPGSRRNQVNCRRAN